MIVMEVFLSTAGVPEEGGGYQVERSNRPLERLGQADVHRQR